VELILWYTMSGFGEWKTYLRSWSALRGSRAPGHQSIEKEAEFWWGIVKPRVGEPVLT